MKTNKMMRIASVLLVVVLLSTCAISGTFAKYTSSATASASATVAKWSFEVNETDIAVTGNDASVTFDLFATWSDTSEDATTVSNNLLAPGTTGSFDFVVQNTSEVAAKYTIVLTKTDANNDSIAIPVQFAIEPEDDTEPTWTDDFTAVNTTLANKDAAIGMEATTHTILWRWVFEDTTGGAYSDQADASDTALGILADDGTAPTMKIGATISVQQVD